MSGGAFDYEEIPEVQPDGSVQSRWRKKKPHADRGQEASSSVVPKPVELVDSAAAPVRKPIVSPLAEFLQKEWGAGEPVVEGWLSTGDIAWLYGQVGHGKTLEACEFALSVASGRPLFGRFATVQGPVLFVEEDCHPQKLQRYLATLSEANGIEDAQVFVWERQFLRLDEDESANLFIDEVLRLRPRLIILDAFLDLHASDGFTGRELRPILDRIAALTQLLPCAVLVLDHTRKEDKSKKGVADPVDALYGGRAKSAVADKMILTKRISDVPLGFEISMPKTRDEPRAPVRVSFTVDEGFTTDDMPATLTPSAQTTLQWAKRQPAGATFTKDDIEQGTNLSGRTVSSVVGELKFNRIFEDAGKRMRAKLYRLAGWARGEEPAAQHACQAAFEEADGAGD